MRASSKTNTSPRRGPGQRSPAAPPPRRGPRNPYARPELPVNPRALIRAQARLTLSRFARLSGRALLDKPLTDISNAIALFEPMTIGGMYQVNGSTYIRTQYPPNLAASGRLLYNSVHQNFLEYGTVTGSEPDTATAYVQANPGTTRFGESRVLFYNSARGGVLAKYTRYSDALAQGLVKAMPAPDLAISPGLWPQPVVLAPAVNPNVRRRIEPASVPRIRPRIAPRFRVGRLLLPNVNAFTNAAFGPNPKTAFRLETKFGPKAPGQKPPRPRIKPDAKLRSRPPGRRTKEHKMNSRGVQAGFAALGALSEGAEVVDSLFEALPKNTKDKWKKKNKSKFDSAGGQFSWDGAQWKIQAVYHNFDAIDWPQAIKNIAKNQVEDQLIGGVNQQFGKHNPRDSVASGPINQGISRGLDAVFG